MQSFGILQKSIMFSIGHTRFRQPISPSPDLKENWSNREKTVSLKGIMLGENSDKALTDTSKFPKTNLLVSVSALSNSFLLKKK